MPEKLVAKGLVTVGGFSFEITSETLDNQPGAPISLSVSHGDQRGSICQFTCWDWDLVNDVPFPVFNLMPDPLLVHGVPMDAWMWWEDEAPIKVFEGFFTAKEVTTQISHTMIVGTHDVKKMMKEGKIIHRANITMRQLLDRLAQEYGITVKYVGDAAGAEVLNYVMSMTYQGVGRDTETNWKMFKHYITSYGFIINTAKRGEVEIRYDKSSDPGFTIRRGDDYQMQFEARFEERRDKRSSRRKTRGHDEKVGKHTKHKVESTTDGGRNMSHRPPATGKKKPNQFKSPFIRSSVKGIARRLERVEGNSMTFTMRMEPRMRNMEQILTVDYGPELDRSWQPAEVEHSIGRGAAQTRGACWTPPRK